MTAGQDEGVSHLAHTDDTLTAGVLHVIVLQTTHIQNTDDKITVIVTALVLNIFFKLSVESPVFHIVTSK